MPRQPTHTRPALLAMALLALSLPACLVAMAPPNLEHALASQEMLAAQHPDDAAVLNDLANLLVLADRQEEAEEIYRQVLLSHPENTTVRFNLALLLQQQGHVRQALQGFREVINTDPYHAWSYYQIGTIFAKRDLRRRALKNYATAFGLDPRLTRPDFNHHLIDNDLAVSAALLAHNESLRTLTAPRVYKEPLRISGLLLPGVEKADLLPPDLEAAEAAPSTRDQAPDKENVDGGATEAPPADLMKEIPVQPLPKDSPRGRRRPS